MSDGAYDFSQTCRDALRIFGMPSQAHKAIEELAELQVAISHYLDKREGSTTAILQEIADVEIMCAQLRLWFDHCGIVDQHKRMIIDRLKARIEHVRDRMPDPECMTECAR